MTPTSIPPTSCNHRGAVHRFHLCTLSQGRACVDQYRLGRSRSAAHSMMSALCAISVAALVYFVCGFAWQGFPGLPAHVLNVGGTSWDWIAAGPFLFRHLPLDGSPVSLAALLGMFSVGLAALIPTGSGCDRWRLGAVCASTALLAGWTFPLFAHWVWGGGWLAELGVKYGMGHGFFVDAGGSGTIQATGGSTALAIACGSSARATESTRATGRRSRSRDTM